MKPRAILLGPLVLTLLIGCKPKSESSATPAQNGAATSSGNHDATGPISEGALGLKIYPGARIVTSGETAEVVSANLQTTDSAEQVVKFYQNELGLPTDAAPTMDLTGKKNNRMYAISVNRSEGLTSASILGKK
jgi:uncharacterized lipoprotein